MHCMVTKNKVSALGTGSSRWTALSWNKQSLSQRNVRSIGGDATVVILHRHEDVAGVAPVGGPGVLYQPVWLPVQGTISHSKHSMVQIIGGISWRDEKKALARGEEVLGCAQSGRGTHHTLVRSRRRGCRKQTTCVTHRYWRLLARFWKGPASGPRRRPMWR